MRVVIWVNDRVREIATNILLKTNVIFFWTLYVYTAIPKYFDNWAFLPDLINFTVQIYLISLFPGWDVNYKNYFALVLFWFRRASRKCMAAWPTRGAGVLSPLLLLLGLRPLPHESLSPSSVLDSRWLWFCKLNQYNTELSRVIENIYVFP